MVDMQGIVKDWFNCTLMIMVLILFFLFKFVYALVNNVYKKIYSCVLKKQKIGRNILIDFYFSFPLFTVHLVPHYEILFK